MPQKNFDRTKQKAAKAQPKTQITSILIFSFSILILFVVLVPGENLWNIFHKFIYGLFGVCSIFLPVLLAYISIILSLEKPKNHIKTQFFLAFSVILFLCTTVFLFQQNSGASFEGYFSKLSELYLTGQKLRTAGIFGGIFGVPLFYLFGIVGSRILILILLFLSVMIFTRTSLLTLFKNLKRPMDFTFEGFNRKIDEKRQKKRINIDIPMSDKNKNMDNQKDSSPVLIPNSNPKLEKLKEAVISLNGENEGNSQNSSQESALDAAMQFTQKQKKNKKEPIVPMELQFESPSTDGYMFPPVSLLEESQMINEDNITEELQTNGQMLVATLQNFGVQTQIINISRGPTVTRYELQPAAGVKISKITNLADDIALNLAASGVRIEAPIPGKAAVGIEIPNKITNIVKMRDLILSEKFQSANSKLSVVLGRDIAGNVAIADLGKMPHLLIAGSTGSGKSVCINSFIVSMLYKATPDEVRFLMIDPKVVELGIYNGIPHLLVPVVTDPRKAAGALSWAVNEMLKRYKIFAENNVRDISSFNKIVKKTKKNEKNEEKTQKINEKKDPNEEQDLELMPQIVIIIDELADLMMAAPNEVEDSICRLAQMARAAGMHLVIATQRPSVDVITGIIKANIPSRVALAVSSQVDSRTILDATGAEKLLGRGDMLFSPIGVQKPLRVQGCFVTDEEIEHVIEAIKETQINDYDQGVIEEIEKNATQKSDEEPPEPEEDPFFRDAIKYIVEEQQASASFLQRKLRVGYARASRLIDQMEELGVVGPSEGSKPRQILITKQQLMEEVLSGRRP